MSTSRVWCCLCLLLLVSMMTMVMPLSVLGMKLSVINGTAGESVELFPGVPNPKNKIIMQWMKDKSIILQIKNNRITIEDSEGRLSMNEETGSITIKAARKSDTGEYSFENFNSSSKIILNVYERIVSVSVESQVSYSPDNITCNITLRCIVNGSREKLSWSRDNLEVPSLEGRENLTVVPSHVDEVYSCTVSNPISSLSGSLKVNLCHPYVPQVSKLFKFIGTGSGLGLLVIVTMTLICCLIRKWKSEVIQETESLYAEIEDFNKEEQKVGPPDVSTLYDVVKITRPRALQSQKEDSLKFTDTVYP